MIPQNPQGHHRKRLCALFVGAAWLVAGAARAQVAPGEQTVTACELLQDPAGFSGRRVQVTGAVETGLDVFVLRAEGCTGVPRDAPEAVWLELPEGSRSRVGPAIRAVIAAPGDKEQPMPPVRLVRDAAWKTFEDALSTPVRGAGVCLGCVANTVTATLVGRVEGAAALDESRSGARVMRYGGYGHLNGYRVRMVVESVSGVAVHPVDYSGAAEALAAASPSLPAGDPERLLESSAESFNNGTAAYGQLRRAGIAFGTRGDRNGVTLRALAPGEDHALERVTGGTLSTDGLSITVDYDPARLNGDGLVRAMAVVGCALADLREARTRSPLVELDGHGLQTLVLEAAATGMRSLTLPGGEVLWLSGWPETGRRDRINAALQVYLTRWKLDVAVRAPAISTAPAPATSR